MNKKILQTVEKYNMLSDGDKVLAGVSGGADSVVLLNFLLSVREKYNLSIAAAHIEHGIRGQESVNDAFFVKRLCDENNIEFHMLTIDALSEAKEAKLSVEEYSRNRRYEFFNSIPCDKIATAHNLTDNIETVLFRLSRGTGLKGACGIPAVRGKVIRPLLEVSSKEIRDYCERNSIDYRIDSTNSDNEYSRNYIRNVILPDFSALDGNFEKAVSRFIANANEDQSFIDKCAGDAFSKCLFDNKLDIEKLISFDTAVIKRVIISFFDNPLDEVHLNEILKLLEKSGKTQIKGNTFAVSDGRYLRIADFGEKDFNDFEYISEILNISEFHKNSVDFYCDYDKIVGNVKLRSRSAGDTVSPAGRGCSKTLKKLYNEYKIPIELRSKTAVAVDDLGVIGVVGYCVDERVKTDDFTKRVMTIKLPSED